MLRKHYYPYINVSLFTELGKHDNEKNFTSKEAKIFPDKFKNMSVAQAVSICFLAPLRQRRNGKESCYYIFMFRVSPD